MGQLEIVRNDIENIISLDNEFGSTVTYTDVAKTFDDDNSINDSVETDYDIVVNLHPENIDEMKMEKFGQLVFGNAKIFFKYQYVIDDTTTIIPKRDNIITFNNTKYRITQLKPWTAGVGVAYYEGKLVREDLD